MEIAGGIGQTAHLFSGRRDHVLMAIARVDTPQAGKSVQKFISIGVGQKHPLARLHDRYTALFMRADRHHGMEVMSAVFFYERV